MGTYHVRFMTVMPDGATLDWANRREAYLYGHRDARHAAAEIAAEADAEIAENEGVIKVWRRRCEEADATIAQLVEALERSKRWIEVVMEDEFGWAEVQVNNPPEGSHLHAINAALKAAKGEA